MEMKMEKISYAIGLSMAKNLMQSGVQELHPDAFLKAFAAVWNKEDLEMTEQEANELLQSFFAKQHDLAFEENLKAGQAFLEENKKKSGVVTLPSGLQYEILTEGTGEKPKITDSVKCHYHGTLIDGTVFDSSVQRGQPATFGLMQVIKGWTEALQLMPVGSKWRLYLPTDLAYGVQGAGASIEPNVALIFDVELLGIE